jgi:arylsulfatase A-like enzyme
MMSKFICFLLVNFWVAQSWASDPDMKPNILIILSDDQGYADAGYLGGKDVLTPHLDRLAAAGVRCTNGYSSHPFCSPTRAGLMTGRYQARFGHENNPVYDPLDTKEGLPTSEKLLPLYFQSAGYLTAWIGKWHLGSSYEHTPWQRGFQHTFGFIGGGHRFLGWQPNERQYTLPLIRQGRITQEVPKHLTTAFGEEAASFIRSDKTKPWMMYLAFNAPHTPHEPTAEKLEKFAHIKDEKRRRVVAQLSLLDDAIGVVQEALQSTGQHNRTFIFFIGDNGGAVQSGANNGNLRDQKGSVYEGGIRVPFIVSWPSNSHPGKTFDDPVISFDVFATVLAASGQTMPTDKKYDAVDLMPYLTGSQKGVPHERLFWRNARKGQAVREGKWKLVRPPNQPVELYDLSQDPSESKNLADQEPDVTKRLATAIDTWQSELIDPVFPGSSVKNEDWGPGGANQKNKPKPPAKSTK